jgi:myo-inositol-1(or 4)-monophosphatase
MRGMLETAIEAAYAAGKLLRQNFGTPLNVNLATHHDIKLEIDEQAQQTITRVILADFPDHAILGEEGVSGRADAAVRWVIDPLDGTVNYFYSIPHYAVSIAAQVRGEGVAAGTAATSAPGTEQPDRPGQVGAPHVAGDWQTVAGVVYAPEVDEMFAVERGRTPTLNGKPIRVSDRVTLAEAIVSIGFFKSEETIRRGLADFQHLVGRVRKMRLMGAAALDVVYVASGRYDAYIEYGIKLWDICAGQLILEQAGGRVALTPTGDPYSYDVRMWNGQVPLDSLTAGIPCSAPVISPDRHPHS